MLSTGSNKCLTPAMNWKIQTTTSCAFSNFRTNTTISLLQILMASGKSVYQNNPELKKIADKVTVVNCAPVEPIVIYNSMIYPLINYRIAGAIWY